MDFEMMFFDSEAFWGLVLAESLDERCHVYLATSDGTAAVEQMFKTLCGTDENMTSGWADICSFSRKLASSKLVMGRLEDISRWSSTVNLGSGERVVIALDFEFKDCTNVIPSTGLGLNATCLINLGGESEELPRSRMVYDLCQLSFELGNFDEHELLENISMDLRGDFWRRVLDSYNSRNLVKFSICEFGFHQFAGLAALTPRGMAFWEKFCYAVSTPREPDCEEVHGSQLLLVIVGLCLLMFQPADSFRRLWFSVRVAGEIYRAGIPRNVVGDAMNILRLYGGRTEGTPSAFARAILPAASERRKNEN